MAKTGRSPFHDALHEAREATRAVVGMGATEDLVNAAHHALAAARRQTKSEDFQTFLFDAGKKLEQTQDKKTKPDDKKRLAAEADSDVAVLLGELHRVEPD